MAVQINLAQVRDKYPELVSAFQAIQQALNTPATTPTNTTETK